MKTICTAILILLCGIANAVQAGDPARGAKELFFDPQQTLNAAAKPRKPRYDPAGRRAPQPGDPASQKTLGLSYWIELADTSGASLGPVTDDHIFKSGDRIRLHFRSNADGRIMLVQLGSSGTASILFPDPAKGLTENVLLADEDHVLPAPSYWFKFDNSPGTEKLLVLFAKNQTELDRSFPTRPAMNPNETTELLVAVNFKTGGKDLMVEKETRQVAEVGTYAVNVSGKPVVLQVALKHR
jgi:uncharacterized protein DUF4384